jgi:hypothetical protein
MREPAGYLKQSPGIGRLDALFNKRDYAAAERCWSDRHVFVVALLIGMEIHDRLVAPKR